MWGRSWGWARFLSFGDLKGLPLQKSKKPLKSHGLSKGISHQIDPTPKGRERAIVPEGSEDSGERREDRRPKRGLESSTEGGRTAWHPPQIYAGVFAY